MQITDSINITIKGDIYITVPASPKLMTTFILMEQGDWFEDEIRFIRHFIKPGMNVIDIGANYGLYTLSISKIIGKTGNIWAFEPTENTYKHLKNSISNNLCNNIELVQAGLSSNTGKAKLFTSPNSELNTLSQENIVSDQYEVIRITTLDHCYELYQWHDIDFIKLDAEGEEEKILDGGKKTLNAMSPLIMFELKHGNVVNLSLVNKFRELGYQVYRLIPGLNILSPFDLSSPFDPYLLNLFCCKAGKAEQLRNCGLLVDDATYAGLHADNNLAENHISALPYGKALKNTNHLGTRSDTIEYIDLLNSYMFSLNDSNDSQDRANHLKRALSKLNGMLSRGENHIERLLTFSRISFDAGERALGVKLLSTIINNYANDLRFEVGDLFLPAQVEFENKPISTNLNTWILTSAIEKLIKKHAFSCYFTKETMIPLFEKLTQLGGLSDEMKKRYDLINQLIK